MIKILLNILKNFQWGDDNCLAKDALEDFAFIEIYLAPNTDKGYMLKLCFPGNKYGLGKYYKQEDDPFRRFPYDKSPTKVVSKNPSSSFIENETIDKGTNNNRWPKMFQNAYFKSKSHSKEASLELFSSGTQMLIRFYSTDGRFPSKGFLAKYKTGTK